MATRIHDDATDETAQELVLFYLEGKAKGLKEPHLTRHIETRVRETQAQRAEVRRHEVPAGLRVA
ncbi:MAG: hypothetical protein ACYC9Q_09250 [Bacillota bacterium]